MPPGHVMYKQVPLFAPFAASALVEPRMGGAREGGAGGTAGSLDALNWEGVRGDRSASSPLRSGWCWE